MKKISLTILIFLLISANITLADDFKSLWKDIEEKRANDLPAAQIELLDKVIEKADQEESYGNLMKAIKERMEVRYRISPDSFDVDVKQLEIKTENTTPSSVLYSVYNSVLGNIYREKASGIFRDQTGRKELIAKSEQFFLKSLSNPHITAGITTHDLYPFFSKQKGTNLLVSLSYNAKMYDVAKDFFVKSNNRKLALIMSLEYIRSNNYADKDYVFKLDSLISRYGDLKECCMVATAKYNYLNEKTDATNEEKIKFVRESLKKWGKYKGDDELKNAELMLTRPTFEVVIPKTQITENENVCISLKNVRNIKGITTRIWKTDLTTTDIAKREGGDYMDEEFYRGIINKLKKSDAITIKSTFDAPDYVYAEKCFNIPSLKKGIYVIETSSNTKGIDNVYGIIYVSSLYVMSEALPGNKTRIAVLDLKSGQPVSNVPLTIYSRKRYNDSLVSIKTSDKNGEILFSGESSPYMTFANTSDDMFMPLTRINRSFGFSDEISDKKRTIIFTDRSVYRPGQTIKVAVVAYRNLKGRDLKTDNAATVSIALKDTNSKVLEKRTLTTDAYGTASAEFVLPSSTLNGTFVITDGISGFTSVRVEEYKRPTFNVLFDEPAAQYKLGDTVKVSAKAESFANAHIQNAHVSYEVKRFWYPWLRYFSGNSNDIVAKGNTITSDKGTFSIDVPLPEITGKTSGFYYFVVDAYVTDAAGETRSARLAMPASHKNIWFDCNMPDKIERSASHDITFSVKNSAGQEISTDVKFYIDDIHGYMVKSNTKVNLDDILSDISSGMHKITAIALNEELEKYFVAFSLNDKVPANNTDEWFYLTKDTFPADGSIYMQVGTSMTDVHALYTIVSGNKIIDMGNIQFDNEVKTFDLKYKEEYGDGILISYAWIKNGRIFARNVELKKALPEKKLNVKWKTFRDRLIPGQKEQWTLNVSRPNGKNSDASVTATLYDMSLDNIISHEWNRVYGLMRFIPYTSWAGTSSNSRQSRFLQADLRWYDDNTPTFEVFPQIKLYYGSQQIKADGMIMMPESGITRRNTVSGMPSFSFSEPGEVTEDKKSATEEKTAVIDTPQLRENLSETAFFYPSLTTDGQGDVNISFTLPDCITTWKFMAFAHDKEMSNEIFTDQIVASKKVMIQPNMPRFIRRGDKTVVNARVMNLSENHISGSAIMQLCDAENGRIITEKRLRFDVAAGKTEAVSFDFDADFNEDIIICKIFAEGKDFSDGEQHYLNILSDKESVTNTCVNTLTGTGLFEFNSKQLFGKNAEHERFTLEFTENPEWFVIQTLPAMAETNKEDAISRAAKLYALAMARHIANASPEIKDVITRYSGNDEKVSLISSLQKDAELKDMMLDETPWVVEAVTETERMKHLDDLFDADVMDGRINKAADMLGKLQLPDGSWSWWQGMKGSRHVTLSVTEMLVRLETMTESSTNMKAAADKAIKYIEEDISKQMKNKGYSDRGLLSSYEMRYLYLKSLRGDKTNENDIILLKNLENKNISEMSIYDKCMAAIIFKYNGNDPKAVQLMQSVKEYSVYNKEMGRYFDSEHADYSWCDYKIPTQVMAIEALRMVIPSDTSSITEMQQWLLQEKRTTSWDTPINSVNAIYAFTNGGKEIPVTNTCSEVMINNKKIKLPAHGTGYIKTSAEGRNFNIRINKKSKGTSWLSLYGTYVSDIKDIDDAATGLKIKREITSVDESRITIGTKVKVRITITADRDYDFVQVADRRAACMEPVKQVSGYNGRYYCSMKDNAAYYFFDMMPKGTHVIETEYYIDREGEYTTGACKIQCAYAPDFNGRTGADNIIVK